MSYNMFFGDCYGDVKGKRAGECWIGMERAWYSFAFVYILKGNYRINGYGRYI